MPEIQRRKYLNLDPEEGVPGNANTIDLPNPRLAPLAPRPAPSLQQYLPRTLTPTPMQASGIVAPSIIPQAIAPLSVTPAPQRGAAPSFVGQIQNSPAALRRLQQSAPPRNAIVPIGPQRTARAGTPATGVAAPAFKFPTSGPRTQGYQAGSAQARGIAQMVNNPAYVPQAGSGLITSSNGTAYSIRPPDPRPAAPQMQGQAAELDIPQGAYQPRTLGGLIAGLAVGQIYQNRAMRQQKLEMTQRAEAQRQGEAAQRLGIDQQNANANTARVNRERYVLGYEERPGQNGSGTIKVPRMFNAETGLPVAQEGQRTGPNFDEFKARFRQNPAGNQYTDEQLKKVWEQDYAGR